MQGLAAAHSPHDESCGKYHRATLWALVSYHKDRNAAVTYTVNRVMELLSEPAQTELPVFQSLGPAACQDVLEEVDALIEHNSDQNSKLGLGLAECANQSALAEHWELEQREQIYQLRAGFAKLVQLDKRGELHKFTGAFKF